MTDFFRKIVGLLKSGYDFGAGIIKYAAKLRPFVVSTAAELEALIPDSGMGSVKLIAFDQALKIFVAVSADFPEKDVEEGGTIWTVAHWLLEAYLSAQKMRAAQPKPA